MCVPLCFEEWPQRLAGTVFSSKPRATEPRRYFQPTHVLNGEWQPNHNTIGNNLTCNTHNCQLPPLSLAHALPTLPPQ